MIGALFLALVSLAAPCPLTPCPLAPADAVVRLGAEPLVVEVGQPVDVTLELEVDESRVLDEPFDTERAFDDTWGVLGLEREAPRPAGAGRVVTRWRWSVASLEPGERSLASLIDALALGEGLAGSAPVVSVTSVLAADAEAPRPLIGWPESLVLSGAEPSVRWPWYLGVGAVLGALTVWFVARSRRSTGVVATTREPWRARVATLRLERLAVASTSELRDAAFRLTALVREAVEERDASVPPAATLPGATDEEWLDVATTRLDAATAEKVRALFAELARIKYAGTRPSALALEQLAREARALLDRFAAPPGEVAA